MSNKVVTFFESIGSWLKAHFSKVPAAEVQISSTVNYLVPVVESLDVFVIPEAAPIVNPILDRIKVGLAALAVTIKQASSPAGKTNVNSIVASLVSNATALEQAFQIKDEATAEKITATLTLIQGELNAIQAQLNPPSSAPADAEPVSA